MNTINSLVIEGNMVKDPIGKETSKGKKVCNFAIASNRSIKNANGEYGKEVSFFDVETWGMMAETCMQEGCKGRGVRVVGRLKQNRWDGADGKHFSKVSIVAEHIEFKPLKVKSDIAESQEENYFETEQMAEEVPAF
ncbi:MAG: single-stranded DNA-binding protein [Treponemataceae bacterium]|nr:single-stranded DNA-binding protein [Spirochaetales bacterium]MDY6030291.1 single-stranded DNA-binding protein [Treponemataceae bacterium]